MFTFARKSHPSAAHRSASPLPAHAAPVLPLEGLRTFESRGPAASTADVEASAPPSLTTGLRFDFATLPTVPPVQRKAAPGTAGLQRKCAACEQEEEKHAGTLQRSSDGGRPGKCAACEQEEKEKHAGALQRSADGSGLAVGPADDVHEREADRVASAVMAGGDTQVRGRVDGGSDAQRDATGTGGGFTAPTIVGEVLRSEGTPLDAGTRAFMESRMGHDFAGVRIHADARADASTRAVNALAYTVGRDIAFRSGHYAPETDRGRRLLAHELAHVCQQQGGSLRRAPASVPRAGSTTSPLLQRQQAEPSAERVTGVRISCEDGRIVFDTGGGSHSYALTSCDIPVGDYTVGVTIRGTNVHFDFGQAVSHGEQFNFGFRIEAGQANPVTLFRGQSQVTVSVVEHLPASSLVAAPTSGAAPLASRLAAFQRLVKNAGKLRLAENGRALEQWRQFLLRLTPAQVRTQVHAEEVRAVLDSASRQGLGELSLAEQWLQTPGANRRWVLEQQLEGRYRACTGCHAAVQADAMDRARAMEGFQARTPLEQLGVDTAPGPRPTFATGEQVATTEHPGVFPSVARAQERVNALQPYLRTLGPDGYRVLPRETLGSAAPASELVADISRRIDQRQADYRELSRRIDAADFDYLQLRPIVRDLLPLADADVREAVSRAIESAETWETIESIVVGAASIGLLLLAIFPPTTAVGAAGALALGTAVSAHQAYRGYESFEQGRLFALGRGAHDVLDPAQQDAAEALMAMGALNMVLGSVGVASGALGSVRLIRAAPPTGGGVGALEAVEGTAGGNLYRVTGWGSSEPRVVVTAPNGQVLREGSLSSFRTSAAGGARATARGPSSPVGGYVYPTERGAALVAQPVPVIEPVPTPVVAPRPVTAPPTRIAGPVAPDVRGPLATMGGTSGVGAITASGAPPSREPVMPSGLSAADQELWRTCNQQHTTYKATQAESAAYSARMAPLADRLQNNRASAQERLDFCLLLDERIRVTQRLHRERARYINLDCDRFDWFNEGTTAAARLAQHQIELNNVAAQLRNFYELRNRFCP